MWKNISLGLGSWSELFCVRDEKTEGLCAVFFSFVNKMTRKTWYYINPLLEKEDMTIKGSLLNSVLRQNRFQGTVFTVPLV